MAKNDKHGKASHESDMDFDDLDFNFDSYDDEGGDDRTPRSRLKKFASTLRDEVLSPNARRQYLHDALPTNYHTSLNSINSIADAGSDLYNDSIMREWEKSRGSLKRALRADGDKLRRFKLGRIADWADQRDDGYQSNYNPEEAEVSRQMDKFGGSLQDAMRGGNLSPQERREFLNANRTEEDLKEDKEGAEVKYQETSVRQQSATVGLLSRILDAQNRRVDYQDQIDFMYKQKTLEFGIRGLIGQRKALEQTALMRAELKEGLTAIVKNTGLPDYVKITSQENAKRLMRDRIFNQASDWAGNKIGGVLRTVMDQTKRNIATMGMNVRDKADMYADGKEMLDGVGMGVDDILMSMGASLLRSKLSKEGGKHIRKFISKNPKYTKGLDLTEAIIANSGAYGNMILDGRSGIRSLDGLMRKGGYDNLMQRQSYRIADSNANKQDQAAFMDKRLKSTFTEVYPAWFNKIWKSIEGIRTGQDTSKIEDQHFDFKFNRIRSKSDLQREFDNETFDESKLKNYNDGIDNWIHRLDPKGTFSKEAHATIRRWLINNHAKNRESFPVALYKGENLPKGTSPAVRRELDEKIPDLAGFDPLSVAMIMDEGVGLEIKTLRQNPEYRKISKLLGNADSQARSRSPIDNQKISKMSERYGHNFLVDSGLGKYDKEGNVSLDNENLIRKVSGGGQRNYTQRSTMDGLGNIEAIDGVDQTAVPKDSDRAPIRHTGLGMDRKKYDQWTNAVLQNINGPRLPGFAKGGFTRGSPDKIAGVTHGDETVIDSQGTKQNKTLLSGIMRLGAPVIKNGKLNRAYFRYLGFKDPTEVDWVNQLKELNVDELKDKAKGLKDKGVNRAKDRLKSLRDKAKGFAQNNFHQDGYDTSFGPTPDFMGPVRSGGLRNDAQGLADTLRDPAELARRLQLKDRLKQARDKAKNFKSSDITDAYEDYAGRARDSVKKANRSKVLDFEATRNAINKDILDGKIDTTKPISLFLAGTNSPFITKGDMAVGRYRNKTSGTLITNPTDIMDDIIFVAENGDFETIATLADMMEGVYDSRGNPIKLPGLEDGYRKYIKRTTMAANAIRNSRVVKFVTGLKAMLWDDIPVDVCIIVNSNLVTVLKASGFVSAQYLDAETLEVLKTHNDIQGAVVNVAGETLLTLEELAGGLYDQEGNQLTISRLKHIRNKIVTKIENAAKKAMKILKDKVASKIVGFLEDTGGDKDVYVMRWMGTERQLTKAFDYVDLEANLLINVTGATPITKVADIVGAVYSKKSKSVILKEDEFKLGLFNSKGEPYKDFKNMTLKDRVKFQQDKFFDKLEKGLSTAAARVKNFLKRKDKEEEGAEASHAGDEAMDVYLIDGKDPELILKKQGFLDQAYRDTIGNVIKTPSEIYKSVLSVAGRILLTKDQIAKGLFTADGVRIKTKYDEHASTNDPAGPAKAGMLKRLKDKLLPKRQTNMEDLFKPDKMDTPYITAEQLNSGKVLQLLSRKPVRKYSDMTQGATLSDDPSFLVTKEVAATLVLADGRNAIKTSGVLARAGSAASRMFSSIGSKLNGMRKGSWQWLQAKREEAERNKNKDVTVNVNQDDGKEKKGFLSRMLLGLGTMFGGMFTTMMMRFGKMFKNIRRAILMSKIANAGGGLLGGAGGGKAGLAKKLLGGALLAGGGYAAYNAMGGGSDDEEDPAMAESPAEQKALAEQEKGPGGVMGAVQGFDDATGGWGTEIATTAALSYGANKLMGGGADNVDPAAARRATLRQRLAARAGRGASGAASAAGRGLGAGARDAGRAGSMLGRVGGAVGRFAGRRLPGVANLVTRGASAVGNAAKWALSPRAALGRLGNVAKIGAMALNVGKFALGAARILSGPIGWGLTAAVWIGGKLWERYKDKKAPLMRFRMAQYGFEADDSETTGKLLDLENLLSKFVTVNGDGQPSIKDDMPEDKIFELFGVDPNDPKNQEHVQRFIAWWIKRFKPVYLSYVKQTHLLLKKFDISQIDDELNKTDKLTLLKGVNFTNKQNNPYLVSASPFAEPAEVTVTIDDVEKAYIKALKFINDMPDDKVTKAKDKATGKDGETKDEKKPSEGVSWLSQTKEAVSDMADKTLQVTKVLAGKVDDVFGGWFSKAAENIKGLWGGVTGWLTSATEKLTAKISEIWGKLSGMASNLTDKLAGSGIVGETIVNGARALNDNLGMGVVDDVKNMLGFESNLGDGEKHVLAAARAEGITNPTEIAALLATTAHESGNFRHTEENLRYSAGTLMKTWPNRFRDRAYAEQVAKGGPQAVANAVYGGRMGNDQPGDGYKYRGRGFIQLTGKANYAAFAKDTGIDALRNPDLVSRPDIAAKSALWFWKKNKGIGPAAQRGDITAVTKIVNGGTNGLSDRKNKFNSYLSKLQSGSLKTDATAPAIVAKGGSPAQASTGGTATKTTAPNTAGAGAIAAGAGMMGNVAGGVVNSTAPATSKTQSTMPTDANARNLPEPNAKTPNQPGSKTQVATQAPTNGKVPPWMDIALRELQSGVGENKNIARANQYFAELGYPKYRANVQSWCAAFVSWCLKESGTPYNQQNPLGAKAGYSDWGTPVSKTDIPYGAIVVVAPSHVFFAAGVSNGRVRGLGGNQGNPGEVKYSNFPLSSVIGAHWPKGTSAVAGASKAAPADTTVQVQQAQQRQQTETNQTDANARKLPEPSAKSTNSTGAYQAAQQSGTTKDTTQDKAVFQLQLDEARKQSALLTDIRDAITGHRSDTTAAGDKTVGALNGMDTANRATVELVASGIGALVKSLQDFSKSNKPTNSLADQFPISASK